MQEKKEGITLTKFRNFSHHGEVLTFIFPFSASLMVNVFSDVSKPVLFFNWSSLGNKHGRSVSSWDGVFLLSDLWGILLVSKPVELDAFLALGRSFANNCRSGVSTIFPVNSKGLWKSKWATVRSIGLVSVSTSDVFGNLWPKRIGEQS